MKARRKRNRKSLALGFSIIEAIVATGVLGIGLVGLVNLHGASMRGIKSSESKSAGTVVADAIAEGIISQQSLANARIPNCNLGPALPANAGCRNGGIGSTVYNAPLANGCTMFFDEPPHMPVGGAINNWNPWDQTLANPNMRYRVDVGVVGHPDNIEHPNAQYLYVWTCWQAANGAIQQVATERMLTFGF